MYISTYKIKHPFSNLAKAHVFIESQFSDELKRHIRKRHLYRIDKNEIILVSEDKPDESKYLISTKEYNSQVKAGQIVNFTLRANALKLGYTKRIPATTPKYALDWLQSQASKRGFEIIEAHAAPTQLTNVSSHNFSLKAWNFIGRIKITNIELFKQTLFNGIGREKAYGCGLLLV